MEFRILKKDGYYYPQRRRKWQIKWRYYDGHPYMARQYSLSYKDAWDIISNNEFPSDIEDWNQVWKPTIIGLGIAGIIGIVLFLVFSNLIMKFQGLI